MNIAQRISVSPETWLIGRCFAVHTSKDSNPDLSIDIGSIKNWQKFQEDVLFHRVSAHVYGAIREQQDVPSDLLRILKSSAEKDAKNSLRQSLAIVQVNELLNSSGIQPVHIKGPVLAHMIYRSVAMKNSRDLDILVDVDRALEAFSILEANGYRLRQSNKIVPPKAKAALVRNRKDATLIGPDKILLELHWRLDPFAKRLLSYETEEIPFVMGHEVHCLALKDNFAYLCLHGSIHNWQRLKWLFDAYALWIFMGREVQQSALAHMKSMGCERAAYQMFRLAQIYLGTDKVPNIQEKDNFSVSIAAHTIESGKQGISKYMQIGKMLTWPVTQISLFRRWYHVFYVFRSFSVSTENILRFPMRKGNDWIYWLIRAPLFVQKILKQEN